MSNYYSEINYFNYMKNFFGKNFKHQIAVFLTVVFVYILLFEFILPVNKILPKPSLLLESYSSLWFDYNLFEAFALTTSVIYLSILLGYLIISLFSGLLIRSFYDTPGIFNGLKIFRYFPAFFYAVVFAYWFEGSIIAEFVFIFIAVVFLLGLNIFDQLKNVKSEYVDAAKSLGISESKIHSEVIWKSIQPEIFDSLFRLHYYVWVLVLLFEFIGGSEGFGVIYRSLLTFQDLAALFALAILISLLIWLGKFLISFFQKKLIYWEA